MKTLQDNKKRLAQLEARHERLVEANRRNAYLSMVLTQSGLRPNPKAEKYQRLLAEIHTQKVGCWIFNREYNKVYSGHLNNARTAVATLTKEALFNLTSPL